jgi:hypothetical protein
MTHIKMTGLSPHEPASEFVKDDLVKPIDETTFKDVIEQDCG